MSELASDGHVGEPLAPIDFYFDFSSPYAYLASELIDSLAERHNRRVTWRPVLLGAAFKVTGAPVPPRQPVKGPYLLHDFERSARFHGIPFRQPEAFPISTQHAARAFLWLHERDAQAAKGLAHALFRAYFTAGRPIERIDTVLDLASSLGLPRADLTEALGSVALKERLRTEVDRAIARGVFGTPFFIVGGEAFWGVDRLPQLDRWLQEGAF